MSDWLNKVSAGEYINTVCAHILPGSLRFSLALSRFHFLCGQGRESLGMRLIGVDRAGLGMRSWE